MTLVNTEVIPVRLEHALPSRRNTLLIDWNVGNFCNYSCSYCPAHLHDGSVWHQTAADAERFVRRLHEFALAGERRVHFQWVGGEPTLCKWLPSIARLARTLGHTTSLISNGARPLSWWERQGPIWSEMTLTFHIEFVKAERFFALVDFLRLSAAVHVNFTMLPDRFDEIYEVALALANRHSDVTISLKPLLIGFKEKLYPYSPEHLHVLQTYSFPPRTVDPERKARGPMRIFFSDNGRKEMGGSRLVALGLNRFRGWKCDIGLELLVVHGGGEVYRANCKEGGLLGTLSDTAIDIPGERVICGREVCKCLADVAVTKWL